MASRQQQSESGRGQQVKLRRVSYREPVKEQMKEEVVYDTLSSLPQHTVRNLPPYTNVSLKLVLSNPEGRKESAELLVLTDQDGTVLLLVLSSQEPSR